MKGLLIIWLISSLAMAQTISAFVPKEIKKSGKYLFYLHGQVVTVPEWGLYPCAAISFTPC